MYDYTSPNARAFTLDMIDAGFRQDFSAEFLRRVNIDMRRDPVADRIVATVRAKLYAEKLPTQSYVVCTPDPRWATWWDHLKATYRDRWWAAAYVRRWPPRTIETTVRTVVNVRSMWVFPDAPYARDMGAPMMWTTTDHGTYPD